MSEKFSNFDSSENAPEPSIIEEDSHVDENTLESEVSEKSIDSSERAQKSENAVEDMITSVLEEFPYVEGISIDVISEEAGIEKEEKEFLKSIAGTTIPDIETLKKKKVVEDKVRLAIERLTSAEVAR